VNREGIANLSCTPLFASAALRLLIGLEPLFHLAMVCLE